ncbi:MAG TPA: TrkA C-terminal domain-containing protein [Nitrospira sp.]|nr:TrkA C-terminal domain-containing protein [Nitrospira sp.]
MSLEFFGRLQKELSLTGSAVYESVVAIAERVNRKVHVLRLHGQAASLLTQIESVQGDLGRDIAAALPNRSSAAREPGLPSPELERSLNQAMDRIHHLKQTLVQVDAQIRDLKLEAIHQDLLTLQRDLSLRAAAIERIPVSHGSPAVGKPVSAFSWPSSVRLVTIFRGPFLIPPADEFVFTPEDIVIVIGLRADLDHVGTWFTPARTAKSAS